MSIVHTDYVFMTIKSKDLRVAVGNKKGMDSIVFTYSTDPEAEGDNFYSYRVYLHALTEQDGLEIQQLIETKQTRKAHNLLFKKMSLDHCLGPYGPVRLSDYVPDDWFAGCKWALHKLSRPRFKGVYPIDIEVGECWF